MSNKKISYFIICCFGLFMVLGALLPAFAENYKYNTANVSCEDYSKLVDEKIYKAVPRSFSYIDRGLQFAVRIKKSGKADKAWILKSSGSEKYDNKVISAVEKVEFGPIPSCAKAKTITYRYDIKKQSKIIPMPIPIWF